MTTMDLLRSRLTASRKPILRIESSYEFNPLRQITNLQLVNNSNNFLIFAIKRGEGRAIPDLIRHAKRPRAFLPARPLLLARTSARAETRLLRYVAVAAGATAIQSFSRRRCVKMCPSSFFSSSKSDSSSHTDVAAI